MGVRRLFTAVGVGVVGFVMSTMMAPGAAFAAPGAPAGLSVKRLAADPHKIQVTWKPVKDAHHYAVILSNGTSESVRIVPANTTTVALDAPEACATYKVKVSARDAAEAGATAGPASVSSLAPGAVAGLTATRGTDRTTATAAWRAPGWPGFKPVSGYRVQLVRTSDNAIISDKVSMNATATYTAVDRSAAYSLRVSAANEFGSCLTAKVTITNDKPAAPTNLTAVRVAGTPTAVAVNWQPPTTGYPVTFYRVGYGIGKITNWVPVNAPTTSTTLNLDPAKSWVVQAQSFNEVAGSAAKSNIVPVPVSIDKAAPTITAVLSQPANPDGWYNSDVTATFTCADVQSGMDSCSAPITASGEGAKQALTGSAKDNSGNTATATATVSIDKSAPTIIASVSQPTNAEGWTTAAVTVHYTCLDALSGVASCPNDVLADADGKDQTITRTATDKAGNSATVSTILSIDQTGPVITFERTAANTHGWNNSDVTTTFTCSDAQSGVASCTAPVVVSTDGANQVVTGSATDKAGNAASTSAAVNVDKTAPTITAALSQPVNADGWSHSAVTIHYTCADALSGVASCPADVLVDADGAKQTFTRTATDMAGNTAVATTTVSVDQVAPAITAAVSEPGNATGWNSGDVTVTFTCSDALSDLSVCPEAVIVSGDGANQVVTGTATDKAGNTATATATVNLDKTAPAITAEVAASKSADGWYHEPVTIHYTCSDAASGIASCPVDVKVDADGADQLVSGMAIDKAGNTATASVTVSLDKAAPTITGAVSKAGNGSSWNNGDVVVSFTCSDTLSDISVCPKPVTVSGDGAKQVVTGTAVDRAGNTATATATVNLDKTAPTITATVSQPANAEGWNGGTVTIHYTCSDVLSGVASCPADVQVDGEGAKQTVTRSVADKAGNSATATTTVNIDRTKPVITAVRAAAIGNVWNNSDVTVAFTCADAVSGVASCTAPVVVSSDGANQVVTGTAVDKGGNAASTTATVSLDKTAPTITVEVGGSKGSNGWYAGAVSIHYTCADALSGVASCPADVKVDAASANQTITRTATDKAGNTATVTTPVNIDRTKPVITGTVVGSKSPSGWYHQVTVHFSCTDALSGIASCPADVQVADGQNQRVKGVATDNAGNTDDTTVTDLDVDNTAPVVTVAGPASGTTYNLDKVPAASCKTTDATSGVDTKASVSTSRGKGGVYTVTCAGATDKAGNTAPAMSISYTVAPTATGLTSLVRSYLNTNGTSNSDLVRDLDSKYTKGQFCEYAATVTKEAAASKPRFTAEQAAELLYWVRLVGPTC